ncbi:hypothetical protein K7W03_27745 [Sphingobium sp. PNB]|uniref:hypothetical protein n=1 Tax=Sphingobium sp. PNB TaxID=863934 RepID=UPI001CA405CE|nr:hypothetical protein [Sphingobium sp. PNB]MCB4863356.1 hypothetical protein [Sphingobium sp. PNB]
MAKETPKQYTGRKLRRKIELAKVAVMEAQQSATEYRGDMAARRLTGCERSDNQDENRLLGCR